MNVALDDHDIQRIAAAVAHLMDAPPQGWLTKQEAAEYLRCSTKKLDQLVYLGELDAYKPAGKRLFRQQDLDDLVHQTKET